MKRRDSEARRQLLIKIMPPLSGYGRERLVFSYDYNINFQRTWKLQELLAIGSLFVVSDSAGALSSRLLLNSPRRFLRKVLPWNASGRHFASAMFVFWRNCYTHDGCAYNDRPGVVCKGRILSLWCRFRQMFPPPSGRRCDFKYIPQFVQNPEMNITIK